MAASAVALADGFEISAEAEADAAGNRTVAVAFDVPADHYLYAGEIEVVASAGGELVPLDVPAAKSKVDIISGSTVDVYDHDVVFTFRVDAGGDGPVEFSASCLGCNDKLCLPPFTRAFRLLSDNTIVSIEGEAPLLPWLSGSEPDWMDRLGRFTVAGRAVGYAGPAAFLRFLESPTGGGQAAEDPLSTVLEERGLWLVLLLVLAGGLALNLTPCVLPMIPVNIAIIGAGAQSGSKGRGFTLGAVYGAGIAVVYGALGLIVTLTGARFGALNSSAWFNLVIAVVFAVLALGTFGVFNLDLTRFQSGVRADRFRRGSFLAAFILGGIAALLAGACVAPVVIWVLVLAVDLYDAGNGYVLALCLPFLLGLGMALPWPFAGAGLSFLPRPGRWMERVKFVFGVIIMICALWYGRLGLSLLVAGENSGTDALVAALEEAESLNRPLLIDFWASWCKNCHKMETTTFKDPSVVARMDDYVVLKFRADRMDAPEAKAVLDHFGVEGLPTYIILRTGE